MAVESVLSAEQFKKEELLKLIHSSTEIEAALKLKRQIPLLDEYILATLFFEPSTRTRLSFEAAMHRLGGRVISSVGVQFSSLSKGETLFDTLKMIEAYADICVIRHPVEGASILAAENISIPVINGGDGAGEHPTQALLDLYTIYKHKKNIFIKNEKLKIAFIGDIKYGRTIHSLLLLLRWFNFEIILISPAELSLPEKYKTKLIDANIRFTETEDVAAIKDCDVAYVTRIQAERFDDLSEYEIFKDRYIVNKNMISGCDKDIIVMHPLPRLSEVSIDLDNTPAAVYFEQANNGLYMRMALLLNLLEVSFEL